MPGAWLGGSGAQQGCVLSAGEQIQRGEGCVPVLLALGPLARGGRVSTEREELPAAPWASGLSMEAEISGSISLKGEGSGCDGLKGGAAQP